MTDEPTLLDKPLEQNTNVALPSFALSYERLKLHELLANLGRRVLYFDTGSVIFTSDGSNNL